MNRDYHLIPYDFEVYDFEEFRREEIENKGRIRWLYGKRKHVFNTGDVCAFCGLQRSAMRWSTVGRR